MTNDKAATKFLVQDLDLYYGKLPRLSVLPAAANPPF